MEPQKGPTSTARLPYGKTELVGWGSKDSPPHESLTGFLQWLFEDKKGYIRVGYRKPYRPNLIDRFFQYPDELSRLAIQVLNLGSKYEMFYGPVLYAEPSFKSIGLIPTSVLWCEFDGNTPTSLGSIPEPHVTVQTSYERHQHWYWKLKEPIEVTELEHLNRKISYALEADNSGWHRDQLLRLPETFNHRKDRQVQVLTKQEGSSALRFFRNLREPPRIATTTTESLPEPSEVLARTQVGSVAFKLLRDGPVASDRVAGLINLCDLLTEQRLDPDDVFSLLLDADSRWGQFKDRPDRFTRLREILGRSLVKYPPIQSQELPPEFVPVGFTSLVSHSVEVDWLISEFLHSQGSFTIFGPPGIGKSQLAINFGMALVLGEPILGLNVERQSKVGFFSLEMGIQEVKLLFATMGRSLDQRSAELLEKNFITWPLGEPMYLNRPAVQELAEALIVEYNLNGIIIDSLGSATDGTLNNDEAVRPLLDWLDRIRVRHNLFTIQVHHGRKAGGDNKKPNKLEDLFGSTYLQARPTVVCSLWEKGKDLIEFVPLKVRLGAGMDSLLIRRTEDLRFVNTTTKLIIAPDLMSNEQIQAIADLAKRQGGRLGF